MKVHKIAGISKHICSREQLFAYQLALNLRKEMREKIIEISEGDYRNLISCYIETVYDVTAQLFANSRKINADALYIAMLHGFYKYMKNSFGVLNYEQIGIIFYI